MHCRQLILLIAAGGLGLPTPAVAQYGLPVYPGPSGRVSLDAFVTSHFLQAPDGRGREALHGAGGRLLYWLGDEQAQAPRLGVGAFLVTSGAGEDERQESRELRSEHFGAEIDLRLPAPAGFRTIEPVFSLGVGAFRTHQRAAAPDGRSGRVETDLERTSGQLMSATPSPTPRSGFALTPGLGARVRLLDGLWLRADVRDAVVFRDGARHYVEAIGGISLAR